MKIQKTTLATLSLLGALLLSSGQYGSDWPEWVRGVALGFLASAAVNFTVGASKAQRQAEQERARQDVR